ncbi:MAG: hypothetical protein NPIRA05_21680 [Nitrospirales bacterium]|nr:MAG: hypothetical protein NPIRA05_21680 [Nitrospirales bacterium]
MFLRVDVQPSDALVHLNWDHEDRACWEKFIRECDFKALLCLFFEVTSGNHRLRALNDYVKLHPSVAKKIWCNIYIIMNTTEEDIRFLEYAGKMKNEYNSGLGQDVWDRVVRVRKDWELALAKNKLLGVKAWLAAQVPQAKADEELRLKKTSKPGAKIPNPNMTLIRQVLKMAVETPQDEFDILTDIYRPSISDSETKRIVPLKNVNWFVTYVAKITTDDDPNASAFRMKLLKQMKKFRRPGDVTHSVKLYLSKFTHQSPSQTISNHFFVDQPTRKSGLAFWRNLTWMTGPKFPVIIV